MFPSKTNTLFMYIPSE